MLADARAEYIRDRLVKMNVANGVRLMEKGDTTGALPWFAEALSFDRDDPDATTATAPDRDPPEPVPGPRRLVLP